MRTPAAIALGGILRRDLRVEIGKTGAVQSIMENPKAIGQSSKDRGVFWLGTETLPRFPGEQGIDDFLGAAAEASQSNYAIVHEKAIDRRLDDSGKASNS